MKSVLESLGLDKSLVTELLKLELPLSGHFAQDCQSSVQFWGLSDLILSKLPPKSKRSDLEKSCASLLLRQARERRESFLLLHVQTVYKKITNGLQNFVRLEDLTHEANNLVPGLTASKQILEAENALLQSQKDGHEINQGIFLTHVLGNEQCGLHLCHASLLAHPRTQEYQYEFSKTGRLELEGVSLRRDDKTCYLEFQNGQYLHAEDDLTLANTEIAADLAILDSQSSVVVMRGGVVQEGKYKGERTFCSGINLTRLYNGKIPYLWYLERDMGIVNKIYRGVASAAHSADEILGQTTEKLWIAAVDKFAIGGGCQYLLVTDINISASDAYLTLPARKEGIIPGVSNMRLPRFVSDRVARQAIMMERRIDCVSPEGKMICDYVVNPAEMDQTISDTVRALSSSGVVSATGNRKAFRIDQEPMDRFRKYMAVYAREQAYCHFSDALISNLERNWDARNRKVKATQKS